MTPNWTWHEFAAPGILADALAARIAGELGKAIAERGAALLAVSGGTTPVAFLQALSRLRIEWEKVTVTLVDERFVPTGSKRSNERMVRENLLRGEAARVRFAGLYSDAADVEEAAGRASLSAAALAFPLDAAVLGMGLDGHTASFFPDANNLQALLAAEAEETVFPVHAESAGEPRLTLPLARLAEARFLALHIEGAAKRDLLLSILEDVSPVRSPIGAVFAASPRPVHIFWTAGG